MPNTQPLKLLPKDKDIFDRCTVEEAYELSQLTKLKPQKFLIMDHDYLHYSKYCSKNVLIKEKYVGYHMNAKQLQNYLESPSDYRMINLKSQPRPDPLSPIQIIMQDHDYLSFSNTMSSFKQQRFPKNIVCSIGSVLKLTKNCYNCGTTANYTSSSKNGLFTINFTCRLCEKRWKWRSDSE